MKNKFLVLFLLIHTFVGCQEKTKTSTRQITDDQLISANKQMVKRDADKIKEYIKINNLPMTETKTGLWFLIYNEGDLIKAKKNQVIALKYKLSLLDGTLLYSSDSLGIKQFLIGQGGVESGLEEAVLMLCNGSVGKFILPPHLAHGLIGDNNKVPSRAILIYDIEVQNLREYSHQ